MYCNHCSLKDSQVDGGNVGTQHRILGFVNNIIFVICVSELNDLFETHPVVKLKVHLDGLLEMETPPIFIRNITI